MGERLCMRQMYTHLHIVLYTHYKYYRLIIVRVMHAPERLGAHCEKPVLVVERVIISFVRGLLSFSPRIVSSRLRSMVMICSSFIFLILVDVPCWREWCGFSWRLDSVWDWEVVLCMLGMDGWIKQRLGFTQLRVHIFIWTTREPLNKRLSGSVVLQ